MMLGEGIYGELSESGRKKTMIADRSSTRLIALINDLLDIEKLESGMFELHLEHSAVDPIIEKSTEAVKALADGRNIRFVSTPCVLSVYADGDRLVQVLVNLLSNAVKYSPDDSEVAIETRKLDHQVEIRVIDTGRGVPAHMRESIFERFKQVDISDAKEKKGTGLGLAICKAIVEQHGGSIGVDSEDGKGSEFWFTVPTGP